MSDTVALLVIVLMLGVLAFLVPFAFHRTLLLLLSGRSRRSERDSRCGRSDPEG